jgi:hypothetical protein
MPRLTPDIIAELAKALSASYRSVTEVEEFLFTKLDQRLNRLSSKEIPLDDIIFRVVQKSYEEAWTTDLARKAAENRPKNAALRKICDSLPKLDPTSTPNLALSQIDRPSLLCGRASQWNEVCQCAPTRLHQVILVPGARGQEPMHFRDRVQVWLTPDPSRTILAVHWPTPPQSLDEMFHALGVALGAGVDGLQQAIREKLAHRNLILLHPCIDEGFGQHHFVEYYTRWLPAALSPRTSGVLKCVQPLEWPTGDRSGSFLARLLSRGGSSDPRDGAFDLISMLKKQQAKDVLRILEVDELLNLESRELEQFVEGSEFPLEHQPKLLARLLGGPHITGYMFKTIDDYWKTIGGGQ